MIEVLKSKSTYAEAFDEIHDMQYDLKLSEYLHDIARKRGMKPAEIMRHSGLKSLTCIPCLTGSATIPPGTC